MAKVDIWMPIYIGDYMANTMRLTTEQHGAYLLMLMESWVSGPLPDDDEELAAITKLPIDRWLLIREKMAKFFDVENGAWTQGRLEKERLSAQERREKAAENGKKGGRPRSPAKPNENPPETHGFSTGNPTETQSEPKANPEHNPGESSSPSPSPIDSNESIKPSSSEAPASDPKHTPDDCRLAEWMAQHVIRVAPKSKPPKLDAWADTIRLMRERDGRTHREIAEVFSFANNDSFWSVNILSPAKLREKFGELDAKMRRARNENTGNITRLDPNERGISGAEKTRRARERLRQEAQC